MSDHGNGQDESILERLQESASGDVAVRQLRRRYDALRQDYEALLERLAELEDRLNDTATASAASQPSLPGLADAISAPLLKLRDDYLSAVASIQTLVTGLEGLATGLKGQHSAKGTPVPPRSTPDTSDREPHVQKVHVEVKGSGFGDLLDFQERLSSLGGVARVSINAIDNERATLV
ncbi:MAG TPA: hypothetical protein PKD27_14785, partial [Tepidiformaceae bacterium]|nr:hypothetical protein [Tepidiformaceae bacterium]